MLGGRNIYFLLRVFSDLSNESKVNISIDPARKINKRVIHLIGVMLISSFAKERNINHNPKDKAITNLLLTLKVIRSLQFLQVQLDQRSLRRSLDT